MKLVASSSKKLYQESGLVEDPNKVIGSRRKAISKKKKVDSKVVQELEKEANKPQKKNFKFSKIMCDDLEYYINKYGDDYQAMARDKKNIYQDSPGQIRQKILKFNKIHKSGKQELPKLISLLTKLTFKMLVDRFWIICKSIGALSERRVVGKPQIMSRLRYVNIVKRSDETLEERSYRQQYESLQDWNNRYWAENNQLFNKEKEEYIRKTFGEEYSSEEALSHDQLASFYSDFLERNRKKHVEYNMIWYRNHIALLASSLNAKVSRLKVNASRRLNGPT